jgi:RNA polymerase sigma factor (sigma-70 family)
MSHSRLICIVDDDPSVRDSLSLLLGLKGYDCRTFESAEHFLLNRPHRPTCLILDLKMAGMNGLALQEQLVQLNESSQIIFLTAHADVAVMRDAFLNKAVDFLEKPFETAKLLGAIDRAFEQLASASQQQGIQDGLGTLSPREREVLAKLSEGLTHREIGDQLGISARTVEVHKAHIMQKLGTKTLAELIRVAILK